MGGAILSAAFFAFLAWLQATQELIIFAHDSRVASAVLVTIAAAYAAVAVCLAWGWRSAIASAFIVLGVAAMVVVAPGRILQPARARLAYGSSAERSTHNALRLLISAQEDHRLLRGRYASAADGLSRMFLRHAPAEVSFAIASADSTSWQGSATFENVACRVVVDRTKAWSRGSRNFLDDDVECDTGSGGSRDVVAEVRAAAPDETPTLGSSSSWSQERGDAARTGITRTVPLRIGWHTRVGGSIRAVAAIADSLVVAGAHGTGWIGALDIRDGRIVWETRAPNWIHQNPVIGSGIVAVGLGDKDRLMAGDPVGLGIGGVAAYDLRSGALVWLERAPGAVMTAPVIWNESVIYADGAGLLWSRAIRTGQQRWNRRMPGYAVMASPALRSDTVFVALAHRQLCAFSAATGDPHWCFAAPRMFRIGGDPTPSVIGGAVYWSVSHERTGVENIFSRDAAGYLRDKLTGRSRHRSSQWIISVDAATGRERWRTELGGGHDPRGNMAGTPIAFGRTVVVTAPLARRTVALDTATGRIVWSVTPDAFTRGAVTIVDSLVITSDVARHTHILDARSGREICQRSLPDASDRSGPTVGSGVAIFTGLAGSVTAVSLERLKACAGD